MRKIFLLTSFFVATPIFLLFSVIYLSFLLFTAKNGTYVLSFDTRSTNVAYTALPVAGNEFQAYTVASDARIEKVKQLFHRYNSPLESFAQNVVIAADSNGIDYKLVPAIAMQESTGCQKIIAESYNCWGFGIYGKHVRKFENYADAIDIVSKTLARDYINKGLVSPEQIEKKYTPPSQGSWAYGVHYFIHQME